MSDNTIVIYTSDNGFFLGDFGLFNKMWMYEESLRLPLLIRYPGHIEPGSVNEAIVSLLDFAPTILDYARAEIPAELQGESLEPVLAGNLPDHWRSAHYYHYYGQFDVPAHVGVRTATHKLIHYDEQDTWELYDLTSDPREAHNLYGQPAQTDIIRNLQVTLKELQLKYESDSLK